MPAFYNGGFGEKFQMGLANTSYELYKTGQFSLDVILYYKFKQYSGRVLDVREADFIYAPFFFQPLLKFGSMKNCQWLKKLIIPSNQSSLSITQITMNSVVLPKFLQELWAELQKLPIKKQTVLVTMSRTAGNNYRQSFLRPAFQKYLRNFMYIGIENWEGRYKRVLMVPYPTVFHLPYKMRPQVAFKERKTLIFYGSPRLRATQRERYTHPQPFRTDSTQLRYGILDALLSSSNVTIVVLSHGNFSITRAYMAMEQSIFCIHPPGDSPTRRGFYDSILLGCIPVVFSKKAYSPFGWNSKSLAIHLAEDLLPSDVVPALLSVAKGKIRTIQNKILHTMQALQYSLSQDESQDAFGTLLKTLRQMPHN